MSNSIKGVSANQKDEVFVNVEWGGRKFIVQINSEGVVVAPPDENGKLNLAANPSVWIDPHDIVNNDEPGKEAPLLVHTYFNNEAEAPVTVEAYENKAVLRGDGLPFVEKP